MKKTLLSIASLIGIATASIAQVTVTEASFPTIGDMVVLVSDTTPTVSQGTAGSGSTWNLTAIAQHKLDTNNFVDPATTPFASDFPNSTIAIVQPNQTIYSTVDANAAIIDGMAGDPLNTGVISAVPFNPTDMIFKFPASLGTSFADTTAFFFESDGVALGLSVDDSIRIIRNAYRTSTIDGDGSLTTPGGTFNAIRQYQVQATRDSIHVKIANAQVAGFLGVAPNVWTFMPANQFIPANPIIDTVWSYTWYTPTEKYSIAKVDVDSVDNPIRAEYLYLGNLLAFTDGQTPASCAISCDGTATVSGTGGTTPYTYTWAGSTSTAMTASGLCEGASVVTVSDGITAVVLDVNITSAPGWSTAISVTMTDANATPNGGVAPYTYLWDDGQTTATALELAGASTHSVTVTDANGCASTASSYITTGTGIKQLSLENAVKVYPNPTNGIFTINTVGVEVLEVTVFNTIGKVVSNEKVISNNVNMDLSNFNKGFYFINITTDKGTIVKRIALID